MWPCQAPLLCSQACLRSCLSLAPLVGWPLPGVLLLPWSLLRCGALPARAVPALQRPEHRPQRCRKHPASAQRYRPRHSAHCYLAGQAWGWRLLPTALCPLLRPSTIAHCPPLKLVRLRQAAWLSAFASHRSPARRCRLPDSARRTLLPAQLSAQIAPPNLRPLSAPPYQRRLACRHYPPLCPSRLLTQPRKATAPCPTTVRRPDPQASGRVRLERAPAALPVQSRSPQAAHRSLFHHQSRNRRLLRRPPT